MQGDFCRMCGSKKIRMESKDILLESQKKTVKGVVIWVCENCGEEFLDDESRDKLYRSAKSIQRDTIMTN